LLFKLKIMEKEFNITGTCSPAKHYMADVSKKLTRTLSLVEKGKYFKEVQTSEEKRLDIVATYGSNKYIIELKRWYGDEYHQRGLAQLSDYLDIHSVNAGYLVIFEYNKVKSWDKQWIDYKGKRIFAVWV
jgi:PD-(D/E)XK nuclease superfamily